MKITRDKVQRSLSIHLSKLFGVKIENTRDASQTKGLHFFFWYPKSKERLAYASFWLPYWKGRV